MVPKPGRSGQGNEKTARECQYAVYVGTLACGSVMRGGIGMSKVDIPQIQSMEVIVGGKRSDQDRRLLLIGVVRIGDVSRETLVAGKGDGSAIVCDFRLAFSASLRLHVPRTHDISSTPFPTTQYLR
jgi:hypothetical protein